MIILTYYGVDVAALCREMGERYVNARLLTVQEVWEMDCRNEDLVIFYPWSLAAEEYLYCEWCECALIAPAQNLKEKWLARLQDRYNKLRTPENEQDLVNARIGWDEDIQMLNGRDFVVPIEKYGSRIFNYKNMKVVDLVDMNYNLKKIVGMIEGE